ncbi:hypothetical protein DYI26_19410 [Halomonas litopenaei]|nr:hypothetical protein [Halomonas litopenaei]
MLKLEQTIVSTADQYLSELEYLIFSSVGKHDVEAQVDVMRSLFVLVELAKFQDSGLTEEAIEKLLHMEAKAMKISGADRLPDDIQRTVPKNVSLQYFSPE